MRFVRSQNPRRRLYVPGCAHMWLEEIEKYQNVGREDAAVHMTGIRQLEA